MSYYRAEYERKLTTPENAVGSIDDGATIIHGVTAAEPPALLAAIAERASADDIKRFEIYSFNPQKHAAQTYLTLENQDKIHAKAWFLGPSARKLAAVGLVQFIPSYLHQVPKFIREYMEVDVCVTTVSPMDNAGYFSFGTANDLTSTAARHARKLIVEVNENMPRVFGDSLIHISQVDAVVENHTQLMPLHGEQCCNLFHENNASFLFLYIKKSDRLLLGRTSRFPLSVQFTSFLPNRSYSRRAIS